ncbi:MAG: aquaporin [Candidatus Micrarchaeota archaeon]|nr:aquaporin [Candidatus Micrarchaeota archaeon]
MRELQPYFAEFFSTFALVFIGAGAVVMDTVSGGALGLLGVAVAHGLVLMSMIYAVGHVSGAHVNPAVTAAMWVTRQIRGHTALLYVVAQLLGAALAGFLLLGIFPAATANLGVPDLGANVSFFQGILVEAVLTFFLVFTIFGVAVDKRAPAGVYGAAIGLVLTFDILFGGLLTGGAMNPARAFGPALASGYWATQLVYWIGPLVGAIVAGLSYRYLLLDHNALKKMR